MDLKVKLSRLPSINLGDVQGKPVEVHEMYNHAGFIVGIYVNDKLELRTLSYAEAAKQAGD